MKPQRRTYYGSRVRITHQFQRDTRQLAHEGYTLASETWIPGVRFLPAMTLCLIVTYHHRDDPTLPPASELQRLIELRGAGAITRRQFARAMRQHLNTYPFLAWLRGPKTGHQGLVPVPVPQAAHALGKRTAAPGPKLPWRIIDAD